MKLSCLYEHKAQILGCEWTLCSTRWSRMSHEKVCLGLQINSSCWWAHSRDSAIRQRIRNETKEGFIEWEGAGRCDEAKKTGVKQADRQVDTECGQTGQVLPPQSPGCKKAWRGKCNRILRGRKKMFRASKNKNKKIKEEDPETWRK